MRFVPDIRYGTERYPEKVARRLRVLNAGTWCCAVFAAGFAVTQLFDPTPGIGKVIAANIVIAILLSAVPLLHRFGSLAAPLGFVIAAYTGVFVVCAMIGTASGMQIQFLAIAASAVLYFGPERPALAAALGVLAVILMAVLELYVPHNAIEWPQWKMFANYIACIVGTCAILIAIVFYTVRDAARAEAAAEREFQRSEALLANILPAGIAGRLKESGPALVADKYDDASVLFADMEGYTARAGEIEPDELVRFLNRVFTAFDQLVEKHGLEKIKTTGDAYMVVSGVPTPRADHAAALARLALAMRDTALGFRDPHGAAVPIRIGMASGPVVAGVVGTRKFFYDVWGDAVNVAARMESTGAPGMIQVSDEARARLEDVFVFEPRGVVDVKGKGAMQTWLLVAEKTGRTHHSAPDARLAAGSAIAEA